MNLKKLFFASALLFAACGTIHTKKLLGAQDSTEMLNTFTSDF